MELFIALWLVKWEIYSSQFNPWGKDPPSLTCPYLLQQHVRKRSISGAHHHHRTALNKKESEANNNVVSALMFLFRCRMGSLNILARLTMLSHLLKYFALDGDTKVNYELRQSQRSQVVCFRIRCWYLHTKLRKITQSHWDLQKPPNRNCYNNINNQLDATITVY